MHNQMKKGVMPVGAFILIISEFLNRITLETEL